MKHNFERQEHLFIIHPSRWDNICLLALPSRTGFRSRNNLPLINGHQLYYNITMHPKTTYRSNPHLFLRIKRLRR
ncbi:hypothetical protein AQUCO_05300050v1 [Aquilegia coerulea]|uniref:Uncharacterized protein n=1 Tax=Aquilegia coerulea TaxID=218851 RepID=A0A2G5CI40_AQUCA|nr:hypothetical protein AQUCO_05300050v1 [Aquilegia coerulea]